MFKFLLYLFLFYLGFRFLFGSLFRINVYHHFNQNNTSEKKRDTKNEASVRVDPNTVKKHSDDKSIGEYVDFEELK